MNIDLSDQEVDQVLNALSELPFKQVNRLIVKIVQQVQQQQQNPAATPAEAPST